MPVPTKCWASGPLSTALYKILNHSWVARSSMMMSACCLALQYSPVAIADACIEIPDFAVPLKRDHSDSTAGRPPGRSSRNSGLARISTFFFKSSKTMREMWSRSSVDLYNVSSDFVAASPYSREIKRSQHNSRVWNINSRAWNINYSPRISKLFRSHWISVNVI